MSIIISKNHKNAVRLDKSLFHFEDNLQQYIYDNPESIPLYDIKEDIRLLILAREFQTPSGPIDAIGVDKDGEIYLIETKLYKNPEKRKVIAQVLDYGASLWKGYTNFEVFLSQIDTHVKKKFNKSTNEKLIEFFELNEEKLTNLNNNLKNNLYNGDFKFVVLMDHINDLLKDLILFINRNSRFNIYGVELEYYKYETFEILIPKLYGAEVKKEISTNKTTKIISSDEDYIKFYESLGLKDQIQQSLNFYYEILEGRYSIPGLIVAKTPKNIIAYFTFPGQNKVNFTLNLASLNSAKSKKEAFLDLWCDDKTTEQQTIDACKKYLKSVKLLGRIKNNYALIAKYPFQHFSSQELKNFFENLSRQT